MQRNINSLIGYGMEATDGEIGEVKEFYFDDETWTIRYIIIKTGNWLSDRKVLISPEAIVKKRWKKGSLPVNLRMDQIRNSPEIDTDKPVYRQQEIELYEHYAWESYWLSGFYPGGYLGVSIPFPVQNHKVLINNEKNDERSDDDLHLRSTAKVSGYHIHANDGEIGHVKDFIIDFRTWQLLYFVVDTHNWLGGKKVLIAVKHVKRVEWDTSEVFVDVSIASVNNSRTFEGSEFKSLETYDQVKVTLPIIPNEIH